MAWESIDILCAKKTDNFTSPEYLAGYYEMDKILQSHDRESVAEKTKKVDTITNNAKKETPPTPVFKAS